MTDSDRFKLHFGPYPTPKFQYGQRVWDEVRGWVTIVGLSDDLIPWPIGKLNRAKSLVVYEGLAEAVRRESSLAIRHWWGVGAWSVWKWRNALEVPRLNDGNLRLQQAHAREPWFREMQKKAWAKAKDPIRREKIAASRRGKPRPPHVIAALRKSHFGRRASAETRQRMSEAHKRRGTRPPKAGKPWRSDEDELLLRYDPAEVARQSGRTIRAVYMRSYLLGIRAGRSSMTPVESVKNSPT